MAVDILLKNNTVEVLAVLLLSGGALVWCILGVMIHVIAALCRENAKQYFVRDVDWSYLFCWLGAHTILCFYPTLLWMNIYELAHEEDATPYAFMLIFVYMGLLMSWLVFTFADRTHTGIAYACALLAAIVALLSALLVRLFVHTDRQWYHYAGFLLVLPPLFGMRSTARVRTQGLVYGRQKHSDSELSPESRASSAERATTTQSFATLPAKVVGSRDRSYETNLSARSAVLDSRRALTQETPRYDATSQNRLGSYSTDISGRVRSDPSNVSATAADFHIRV